MTLAPIDVVKNTRRSPLIMKSSANGRPFRIRIANTLRDRKKVYQLINAAYVKQGLVKSQEWQNQKTPFDADPSTIMLWAESEEGAFLGTISLVFDSGNGLPCNEDFKFEADLLRTQKRRLVEVTRFVIGKEHKQQRAVMRGLINVIFIHGCRVMGYTDFVIEVHPKHVGFYEKSMLFEVVGTQRPCQRVQGKPAVLLRCAFSIFEEAMSFSKLQRRMSGDRFTRTLYRYFGEEQEERRVQRWLSINRDRDAHCLCE